MALGGPRVAPRQSSAVLCHGAGGEWGTGAAPSQNLGAAPPAELSPQRTRKVPGLEQGWGGHKVGARGAARTPGSSPPAFAGHGGDFHLLELQISFPKRRNFGSRRWCLASEQLTVTFSQGERGSRARPGLGETRGRLKRK